MRFLNPQPNPAATIPGLSLRLSSIMLSIFAALSSGTAVAADQAVRGTLAALRAPASPAQIFLSVNTREGVENFKLQLDNEYNSSPSLIHLRGETRPRRGRGSHTPVAGSRININGRYVIFFTSSRWGVPSSVSFSLAPSERGLQPVGVRVIRGARRSLPCGSDHSQHVARAQSGAARRTVELLGDGNPTPFNPPRVVDVATRADYDFYLLYGASSYDYIAATVHAAEVLYAAPLGIHLRLASQEVQSFGTPSTAPVEASGLLEGFRQQSMAERTNYDVFHLFTGRPLTGRTIGIAYVGSACSGRTRFNIGLSRAISQPLQPLLFAHEVAHNLGSYHDTVPNSVMNPVLSPNNSSFSQISLAAMKSAVSSRMRCISRLPEHELSLSLSATNSQSFNASVMTNSLRSELCSVGLFAQAWQGGKPFGPNYRVASQQVLLAAGENANSIIFSAPIPPAPVQSAQVAFQLKTWCRSRTYLSPGQILQVSANSNGASSNLPADGRQWVLLLRSALSK